MYGLAIARLCQSNHHQCITDFFSYPSNIRFTMKSTINKRVPTLTWLWDISQARHLPWSGESKQVVVDRVLMTTGKPTNIGNKKLKKKEINVTS